MDNFYKFLINLVTILKPIHKNWVVSTLLISGLAMLSQPWWIPYLNIAIQKTIESSPEVGLSGWFLIATSIILHFINRIEEYFQSKLKLTNSELLENDIEVAVNRFISSSERGLNVFKRMVG